MRSSLNNWPPVAANMSAIYAVWLWSKNTGDWQYATDHWAQAQSLFNNRKGSMKYYADIAGAIGYYRLATQLNKPTDATNGMNAAVAAMQAGLDFNTYLNRGKTDYPDPRNELTGWSAPVFYGMTPEVGLYLREQFNGAAANHLVSLESLNGKGNGMVWWYITRVGEHAENGETSFLTPIIRLVAFPRACLYRWRSPTQPAQMARPALGAWRRLFNSENRGDHSISTLTDEGGYKKQGYLQAIL